MQDGKQAISIHAPAKGATMIKLTRYFHFLNFNPRSREGSDPSASGSIFEKSRFQSTLPRRERRRHRRNGSLSSRNFNPRSREGSDISTPSVASTPATFQSTLPRRERQKRLWLTLCESYFNPRSREGSDREAGNRDGRTRKISIHAPAKGATAKITKTIPNDFCKINNYNNSFA